MTEETLEYLAARRYGYRLLQRLLGTDPVEELLASIDAGIAAQSFEIMTAFSGRDAGEGWMAKVLSRIASALSGDGLDALACEYGRCLVGPRELPAPPFESVYKDRRRVLLTPTTLEVRRTYQASGFEPLLVRHVADDHVALELDFLAILAERAFECAAGDDQATSCEYLKTAVKFIDAHLGMWMDAFAKDLREKADSDFYANVAAAMAAFVAADAAGLKKLDL